MLPLSKSQRVANRRIPWRERAGRFKAEIVCLTLALRHPGTPWYAKLLVFAVVGYAFSPIDLIPDFVPVLGYLDDLVVLPLGVWLARRLIPRQVMVECRNAATVKAGHHPRAGWVIALLVGLLWLGTAVLFSLALAYLLTGTRAGA